MCVCECERESEKDILKHRIMYIKKGKKKKGNEKNEENALFRT